MAAITAAGFAGYRVFAPAGWEPPADLAAEPFAQRLAEPGVWAVVAEHRDRILGHASYRPGLTLGEPSEPVAGLAHLWQLFVAPEAWGTGLAARLLAAAVDAARGEGYERMRLLVAAQQARARAFYRREGFMEVEGTMLFEAKLGLEVVQMMRPLR